MASSRTSLSFFGGLIDTSTLSSLTFASSRGLPWKGVSDALGLFQPLGTGSAGCGGGGSPFLSRAAKRVRPDCHRRSLGNVLLVEVAVRKGSRLELVTLGFGVAL